MRIGTALIVTAVLAQTAGAQTLRPTKKDVEEILTTQVYLAYPEGQTDAFEQSLKQSVRKQPPDAAADALAVRYGFPAADMRRFVAAWIIAHSRRFDEDKSWVDPVRAELYAVAPHLRNPPLGLTMLAEALDMTGDDCPKQNFDVLMRGSTAPAEDGYAIASIGGCLSDLARAAVAAGDRDMPALIRLAEYGGLPPRDLLTLYAWLTSPAALAHIRESDRRALSIILWRRYFKALFDADLNAQALALYDAMPADLRSGVTDPRPRPKLVVKVDDITMTFKAESEDGESEVVASDLFADAADASAAQAGASAGKTPTPSVGAPSPKRSHVDPETPDYSNIEAPILSLVEAMVLADRDEEARRLLSTLPGLGQARVALTCEYTRSNEKAVCPDARHLPMGALAVDQLLNRSEEDPYPIAEVTLSGSGVMGPSANGAILCRLFPKADNPDLCPTAGDDSYFAQTDTDPEQLAGIEAALTRLIPEFGASRTAILGAHDVPAKSHERWPRRAAVAAVPPAFAEAAIPADHRGTSVPVAAKALAPLPNGFELVRAERDGRHVVAISLSQTYDPTGEVSQGGYWVHISTDGGRHWRRPLYTGLADRFPYVVPATSPLPLIAGDILQLAVNVAELDTSSITYPPVALRSRRDAKGRFLAIPFSELEKDSDGDGLTDLAAHHLLLDRPRTPGATPFVVGSDYDADCRVTPSAEKLALVDLLGRMSGQSGAAIVEPVDRPAGQIGNWRSAAAATDQPMFVIGRAEAFSCLSSRRLIVVYSKADIEALGHFTPDFHAVEMPPIVFNRAHDRGFVRWSTGWSGGTYRLRRVNGKWVFDTISSWIS